MADSYFTPLKRLFRLLDSEKRIVNAIFFYAVLNGVVILILPLGIQAVLTYLLGGRVTTAWVFLVIFIMLALLFAGFMRVAQISLVERLQQRIYAKAAYEFSYRIPRFKLEELYRKYAPELMNRFFDIMNIQKGVHKILIDFITAALEIFFGLILLIVYHPVFIAYSIGLVFFMFLLFKWTSPKAVRTKLDESSSKYKMAYWLQEMSRTLATFKLAGQTRLPENQVDKLTEEYLTHRQSHFRIIVTQFFFMIGFKVLTVGVLLIVGSLLLLGDEISIGQFVAAEVIIVLLLGSIEKVILSLETIYDTIVGAEKVGLITDIELEHQKGESLPERNGHNAFKLEFQNVSFTYPGLDAPILNNLNLSIEPGSNVIIAGEQGTGKSTLLQLAAGLYSSYKGRVFINDMHLDLLNLKKVRSYIGDSMSQQTVFNGTLKENIVMERDNVTDEDFYRSMTLAGLDEYVKNLESGVHEKLLPQGELIPSDIVRKIVLARSFCHSPGLLLMESPVLDLRGSEKDRLLNHIFSLNSTLLAVSHDDALLKRADRIITLRDGKVDFDGDYETYKSQNN